MQVVVFLGAFHFTLLGVADTTRNILNRLIALWLHLSKYCIGAAYSQTQSQGRGRQKRLNVADGKLCVHSDTPYKAIQTHVLICVYKNPDSQTSVNIKTVEIAFLMSAEIFLAVRNIRNAHASGDI